MRTYLFVIWLTFAIVLILLKLDEIIKMQKIELNEVKVFKYQYNVYKAGDHRPPYCTGKVFANTAEDAMVKAKTKWGAGKYDLYKLNNE